MSVQDLRVADIRTDGGTQMRAQLDLATCAEYADAMQQGAQFPPVVVFYDGSDYWLADGFQRHDAARSIERETIAADVRAGTRRDAILYAVGANATHGLPRSNADKRRAVETMLRDAEWAAWSDREIARQCGVTHPYVSKVRDDLGLSGNRYQIDRRVTRNGTDYTINTANIGRRAEPEPTPAYEPVAAFPMMHIGTLDGAEAELERRMERVRAQAEADMTYDAPEADTVSMGDLNRAIADARKESPYAQSIPFTSLLLKLDDHRSVKEQSIEAWLEVTPVDRWNSATEIFTRLRAWMDDVERRMEDHKKPQLRVVY